MRSSAAEAAERLERATAVLPPDSSDMVEAYLMLGGLAAVREDYATAEQYYTKVLALRPDDARAQESVQAARHMLSKVGGEAV